MKQDTKKNISSIIELEEMRLNTAKISSMEVFLNIIAEALDIKTKDTASISPVKLQEKLYDNIIKRFYNFCRETVKDIKIHFTKLIAIDGVNDFFKELSRTNKALSFLIFMAFDNLKPKAKKISNQTQGHLSYNNIWQKAKTLPLGASRNIPCLENQKKHIVKSLLSQEHEGLIYHPKDRIVESVCKKLSFHHIMPKSHVMRFLEKLSVEEKKQLMGNHMSFFNYKMIYKQDSQLLDGSFNQTKNSDISLQISLMLFANNMFLGPKKRNDDPGDGCDCPTDDVKIKLAKIYGCNIDELDKISREFITKNHEISQTQKSAFLEYFSHKNQAYKLNTTTKWSFDKKYKLELDGKGTRFIDVVKNLVPKETESFLKSSPLEAKSDSSATTSTTPLKAKKRNDDLWKQAKKEKLVGETSLIKIKNEYVKDIITKIGIEANDGLISLFSNKLSFHHKIPKAFIQKNLKASEDVIIAALLNPINMFLGPVPEQRLDDPVYAADYNFINTRERSLSKSSKILNEILPLKENGRDKNTDEALKQKQIEIYTKYASKGFKARVMKALKIKFEEDELQADIEESNVDSISESLKHNITTKKDKIMTENLRKMVSNKSLLWEIVGLAFKKKEGTARYIAVPIVQKSKSASIGMNTEEYIYFMAWLDFERNNYDEVYKKAYETMAKEFTQNYIREKENRTLFDPKLLGIENFPPSTSLNQNKAINSLLTQNTKPLTSGDDSKKTNASTMSTKKLSLHR